MSLKHKLMAVAVVVCWALNMILVKHGLDEIPPMLMSALRFMLVAVLVVPFTRLSREQMPWVLAVSVTFGLFHFGVLFLALSMAEAGTASILVQLGAPIATVLASLIFHERLGPMRIAGIGLSVLGIAIIAAGPTIPAPLPFTLLIVSATGWAVTNLIVKSAPSIRPLTMMGWSSMFAVPQLLVLSWLFEGDRWSQVAHAGVAGWSSVVYSAVMSSIIAYGAWYWLLQRHSVNRVVPFSMLNPLLTVIFGIVLLGDVPAPVKIVGTLVMLAGVALILRTPAAAPDALKRA